MKIIRKALWGIVLILILTNVCLEFWHRGFDSGYSMAMSDVLLQIETPENYFIKKFDIQIPRRVQQ
jgi:hypothetical protein